MTTDLKIHRDFLFGGFNAEYSATLEGAADNRSLLRFAEGFLKVLPPEVVRQREVTDIKGRDSGNLIDRNTPPNFLPIGDEYFYLAGELRQDEDREGEDEGLSVEGDTFFISVNSKFSAFSGSAHITHSSVISSGGGIPEDFSLRNISEELEADIALVRGGVDLFESHRLSFVGFAPQVTQTFLIEANTKAVQIKILAERLKTRDALPLQKDGFIERINTLLVTVFNFNLISDYRSRTG